MDRLLWYVFAGSRGGATRTRIMTSLLEAPQNTHQLSKSLGMDYKTIQYNLRVLEKHILVVGDDADYGKTWRPSKNLLAVLDQFKQLADISTS